MKRKKTIRKLPEKTREFTRLVNKLQSASKAIEKYVSLIAQFETESAALYEHTNQTKLNCYQAGFEAGIKTAENERKQED